MTGQIHPSLLPVPPETRPYRGGIRGGVLATLVAILFLSSPAALARPAPDTFANLAEDLLPAVVNVSTTQVIRDRGPEIPRFPPGSPFEEFFREFFEREGRNLPPRRATSLGSGFVIDPSGYVVTNNHVIADADEIVVKMQDDAEFKATVIGRDPKTDLALLKVEADEPLPALTWGDSDTTRVGDWILAIGNPFGLGGTVTAGIVSARARDINAGPYDDFLQTDASINRGNSGGPMFNTEGKVIGINTAIFSPSGGSIGIGFAIPSNLAKPVIQQLKEFGRTRRGWLGVRIQGVTEEIADSLGLEEPRGALVASVTEGGPAEKAGIQAGDVIIEFDGREVPEMRDLPRMVAETPVNKTVELVVWRNEEKKTLEVTLGELEQFEQTALTAEGKEKKAADIEGLGLTLSTLTADLRSQFELGENAKGVVVTEVAADSPAGEKGLRPGDVIVEVSQEEVTTPEQVSAKVKQAREAGRKSVLLLVERSGDLRFIALRVDTG